MQNYDERTGILQRRPENLPPPGNSVNSKFNFKIEISKRFILMPQDKMKKELEELVENKTATIKEYSVILFSKIKGFYMF